MDDELLQDFLVEAGEILEQLNEQLVDLEQRPDDKELLNTVFRGFHTIKGGAGFLGLDSMVVVCHRAEDIFNLLRNGERTVDANLMDVMLPVLDVLNGQFEALRSGDEPEAAAPEIISGLERILSGEAATEPVVAAPVEDSVVEVETTATAAPALNGEKGTDITDEEFENLLDVLSKPDSAPAADTGASANDDITDDEFETLLDNLHGKGKFNAATAKETAPVQPAASVASPSISGSNADDISDDEFEALLDNLHGKGKFKATLANDSPAATPAAPAAKPKPAVKAETSKPNAAEAAATSDTESGAQKDKAQHQAQAETTVRVDTKRLDDIMNMVGELVLVRNRIGRLGSTSGNEEMVKAVANLDLVTSDLQMAVMKTRMQPIKKVFGRFPRVVRDLARSLKKEIRLEMHGEDTDLDKNLVDALADPLVHLVRNSVDHGIEMPDERVKAGKPREGVVLLTAAQEGDHILLTIEDDGKGMDPDVLRKIAVDKGLMDTDAAARLENKDCYNLVFAAGFSTKKEISDISGRGVGMDVVKTRISQLNGSVEIDSEMGTGSKLSIKLPLTLAIMPTLMVQLKDQLFALPLVNVNEIFHLDLSKTNIVDKQLVVVVRERTIPLYYLNRWLVKGNANVPLPNEGHVVVVHVGTQKVGFLVDELIGQEEVVIKPLGALLHGTEGLAGATITGDGGIAIILDVPGLMHSYANMQH